MKKILALVYTFLLISASGAALAQNEDKAVEMATDSVKLALNEQGVEGKLKVGINGAEKGFRLKNSADSYEVFVNNININEKARFWKAELAFTTKDNHAEKFNVSGTFDQLVSIPVLSKNMQRDTVIKEEDISSMEIPASQVRFDTITDTEKLVGQALKRTISSSTPIKERDLQKAQIIQHGNIVNLVYNTPAISLKTVGVAMENGGQGDIIRVKNSSSGKIIQGIVQDEQNVAAIGQDPGKARTTSGKTAELEGNSYVR